MMQIRCQKCGWSFTLGHDVLDTIMAEIQDSKATHYMLDCPKCRHSIKVQTRQLRRFYRPQAAPESADEESTSGQDA
jgi:DNA-directed RNA polymerase subunit M/transcription elongation factor TFIIS